MATSIRSQTGRDREIHDFVQTLVEIHSVVPEKNVQKFANDDRRKQITIGHQSDSGDLKTYEYLVDTEFNREP